MAASSTPLPSGPEPAPAPAQRAFRWIGCTCIRCDRYFRRRTRAGLFFRCPYCGHLQDGPGRQRQREAEEAERLRGGRRPLPDEEVF